MRFVVIRKSVLSILMVGSFSLLVATGCTGSRAAGSYFLTGEADPSREKTINDAFADASKSKAAVDSSIKVLIDSIPEGISYGNDLIGVEEGYEHEILGKFELLPMSTTSTCGLRTAVEFSLLIGLIDPTYYRACTAKVTHAGLVDEARRMATEAGGDLVIGTYLNSEPGKSAAMGFSGWILKRDPRFQSEPIETKPAELPGREI